MPRDSGDSAVVDDELPSAGLVSHLHSEVGETFDQQLDDHRGTTRVAGDRNLVPTRGGNGHGVERPHLLVAGVHQTLRLGLDDGLLRVVTALELKAESFEPVEMLDAVDAVRMDLVRLGVAGDRGDVPLHLLGGIVVSGGFLDRRTAAEVEVSARQCRRAAGRRRTLENQNACSIRRRLHRGATARDAQSDHHDVDLVAELRHRAEGEGVGNPCAVSHAA